MTKSILYIANYKGAVGGISGQVLLLHEHMQQEEYHTTIFSTIGSPIRRILLLFRLLVAARNYDVLHIHGCSHWGMLPVVYGIIAGKLWGKRIIVTYHGGGADVFFEKHIRFVRRWLLRADYVIVLNGYLAQVFDKYQLPYIIIPNILPDAPAATKRDFAPNFISVRHLRELYNIPCILRAFERVQKLYPEAILTILGQGDLRPMLEQYVKEHHLQHVQFVGQVPQGEVVRYLQQASILLSSPRIDNMPVSVMEAMQQGLLVISSRVGGVPYVVEDGRTGLLFESDNDKEMAEKMLWALHNAQDSISIMAAAQKKAEQFSWNNVKKKILQIYEYE